MRERKRERERYLADERYENDRKTERRPRTYSVWISSFIQLPFRGVDTRVCLLVKERWILYLWRNRRDTAPLRVWNGDIPSNSNVIMPSGKDSLYSHLTIRIYSQRAVDSYCCIFFDFQIKSKITFYLKSVIIFI